MHLSKMVLLAAACTVFTMSGAQAQAGSTHCIPQQAADLKARPSPYDSVMVMVGNHHAMLCYGRPSAKGRTMIGGAAVPFGKIWRTGANEPTIIHLPFAATIAGVKVEPGSYSIYSVPGASEWEIIVNRSITQWGAENRYTDAIKAQEVGRGKVKSEKLPAAVETFTIKAQPAGQGTVDLVLDWEKTRVRIPVKVVM